MNHPIPKPPEDSDGPLYPRKAPALQIGCGALMGAGLAWITVGQLNSDLLLPSMVVFVPVGAWVAHRRGYGFWRSLVDWIVEAFTTP